MKNITITIDDSLADAAKRLPQVRKSSLSGFIASLLRREVARSPKENADKMIQSLRDASLQSKSALHWDRESIYDR